VYRHTTLSYPKPLRPPGRNNTHYRVRIVHRVYNIYTRESCCYCIRVHYNTHTHYTAPWGLRRAVFNAPCVAVRLCTDTIHYTVHGINRHAPPLPRSPPPAVGGGAVTHRRRSSRERLGIFTYYYTHDKLLLCRAYGLYSGTADNSCPGYLQLLLSLLLLFSRPSVSRTRDPCPLRPGV